MSDFAILVNVLVVIFTGYELNDILNNSLEIHFVWTAFLGYWLIDSLKQLLKATLDILDIKIKVRVTDADE